MRLDGTVIWYSGSVFKTFEPRLFDPDWLEAEGYLQGGSQGRAMAYFLRFSGRDMVLRHFRRGGLVGKVNRDYYVFSKVKNSRAMREFSLLGWMLEQGFNVPRPLAAQYVSAGPFYQADLITERIPNARPLAEVLLGQTLDDGIWQSVGAAVRRLHDAAVHHADLNCRNILIDDQETVWLIDFDKSDVRQPGNWTENNLARLKRSLEKEQRLHPELNWDERHWATILAGYSAANCE